MLIETFEFLKQQDRPVLLHVLTQKGNGFEPALREAEEVPRPRPLRSRRPARPNPPARRTYSEVFAETLTKLADHGSDKVVAITAAMPNGTALDLFRRIIPKRYFDVGIAEEHAVLFAAGMATKGFQPFCAIYSTFLQRAFDQIVHDVACRISPSSSAWIAAASPATTVPRTTASSTSAICVASPTSSTWIPRTKTNCRT